MYPGYNWAHFNTASTNIGNLKKAEDVRTQKEKDNTDWNDAVKVNSIDSYKHYLNIHPNGLHKKEAYDAIAKLEKQAFLSQENIDWQNACRSNTLSAYKVFVSKYTPSLKYTSAQKYTSAHLEAAKQKIAELTPPSPVPTPIKWWKWIGLATLLVLGWLTYVQWHDGAWPFNINSGDEDDPIQIVEDVDSLTWAITNHSIPMLQKYANVDSTRALYPLSLELWNQRKDTLNSLLYIREALSTTNTDDSLYQHYVNQLEVIKNALDYYGTIGHEMQPLPANIEERLPILVTERRIHQRALYISTKYDFSYTGNPVLFKYIDEDFERWTSFAKKTTNIPSKIDAYNAALQLKEDSKIRDKLEKEKSKYNQQK